MYCGVQLVQRQLAIIILTFLKYVLLRCLEEATLLCTGLWASCQSYLKWFHPLDGLYEPERGGNVYKHINLFVSLFIMFTHIT